MGENKLFSCNTPRVFTTRNAGDKAALLTATMVKPEAMATPEAKLELLRVATAYERLARYTRRRREVESPRLSAD